MTSVDLITGFLGAGKTTFIRKYAGFLKNSGQKFAVIENEFGAAGVDTAILKGDGLFVEELAGGCICCSLKVNFHDTLIALAKSYDRVIVEPSGIFSPGDFFDIMNSPDVGQVCQIGCVIAVLDSAVLYNKMSAEDEIVLAGELFSCGHIVISKTDSLPHGERVAISERLSELLSHHAPEAASAAAGKIYKTPLPALSDGDFTVLKKSGYGHFTSDSLPTVDHTALFQSCTLYPRGLFQKGQLEQILNGISGCGDISRVKGYVLGEKGGWFVNYTSRGVSVAPSPLCEKPMLNIIGRRLNRKRIKELLA